MGIENVMVFKFGDDSVQFWPMDLRFKNEGESDDEFIARMEAKLVADLLPNRARLDGFLMDDAEYAAHLSSLGDGAKAKRVAIIPYAEYLSKKMTQRHFREGWAWKTDAPVIDFDMQKCTEIHKHKLRRLRAPKLAELDVEYQRADEEGDTNKKREIAKQKKALRDVTANPALMSAKTPDELTAILPEILK